MCKKYQLIEILDNNPVIAVVKNLELLKVALDSSCHVIFILTGGVFELSDVIRQCKERAKLVFIHFDKIKGFSANVEALSYIKNHLEPDGIISCSENVIQLSKQIGLFAIQRYIVVDSITLEEGIENMKKNEPDIIEILPGILGQVLYQIAGETDIPVLSGGLVHSEYDVIYCLKNGALGVSTTNTRLWYK